MWPYHYWTPTEQREWDRDLAELEAEREEKQKREGQEPIAKKRKLVDYSLSEEDYFDTEGDTILNQVFDNEAEHLARYRPRLNAKGGVPLPNYHSLNHIWQGPLRKYRRLEELLEWTEEERECLFRQRSPRTRENFVRILNSEYDAWKQRKNANAKAHFQSLPPEEQQRRKQVRSAKAKVYQQSVPEDLRERRKERVWWIRWLRYEIRQKERYSSVCEFSRQQLPILKEDLEYLKANVDADVSRIAFYYSAQNTELINTAKQSCKVDPLTK